MAQQAPPGKARQRARARTGAPKNKRAAGPTLRLVVPPTIDDRWEAIPHALRIKSVWLVWKRRPRKENGKFDKVPYYVNDIKRHGRQGTEQDRANLATFEAAYAAFKRGGYDGLGFAMLPDNDLVALDIDNCVDADVTLSPLAREILDASGGTYAEISPSGGGLRIFFIASLLENLANRKNHSIGLEIFQSTGFVTVTGNRIAGTEVKPLPPKLRALLDSKLSPRRPGRPRKKAGAASSFDPTDEREVQALESALTFLAERGLADNYEFWRDVCIALGGAFQGSEQGWDLCEKFASHSAKRSDPGTTEQMQKLYDLWRTEHDHPITVASIFRKAKELGWTPPTDGRPVVKLREGGLADFVDAAIRRLAEAGVFQRTGRLVKILRYEQLASSSSTPDETAILRAPEQAVIATLNADALREVLARAAAFQKRDGRGKARLVDCPLEYVRALAARGEWPGVPALQGIVDAPTLRADGSVLQTPGYDAASGLYLNSDDGWLPLPDKPTRSEALAALEVLRQPFEEFRFADPVDESATLAAVLTAIACPVLPKVPFIAISAPTAGSGKGLLCEVIGLIGTGQIPPKSLLSLRDDAEVRKVITSAGVAGDPVLCFDNLPRGTCVRSAALNSALTSGERSDRLLGSNTEVKLPFRMLVLMNGNNFSVDTDMVRRGIFIRIEPRCERPEERPFKRPDLIGWVRAHRRKQRMAGLTILRAYVVARKRANMPPPLGSFEAWSHRVRDALLWLGLPDPVTTQQRMRALDEEQNALGAVFGALHAAFGEKDFTAAEVVTFCRAQASTLIQKPPPVQTLFTTISEVLDAQYALRPFFEIRDGLMNAKSAGRRLIAQVGQVVGALSLASKRDLRNKVNLFRMIKSG